MLKYYNITKLRWLNGVGTNPAYMSLWGSIKGQRGINTGVDTRYLIVGKSGVPRRVLSVLL